MLSMYELRPFWLAKGTKNVFNNIFNQYVASLEPRARQRYSEKLDIVGLLLEQHFLKRLEQPYVQQLTTMALSILYQPKGA